MKVRSFTLLGLALVLAVVLAAPPPAEAHNWGCWRQPNRTVYVRNTASNWSQANAALNEWDADTILSLPRVSYHTEVSVLDGNYGNTGWGGLASIESASGCNILHGHATLNTYYGYSSNAKRGVFCQEVGHLFGLDHSNDGGCMGGGYYYSISTNYNVVSHNINDIANKYAGVPLATTPEDLVDRHGEEGPAHGERPLVHAVWYHNPRTLGEVADLAKAVVVARVEGVFDAPDIVVKAEGLENDEHRVPNQRIAFSAKRILQGSIEPSFDLFHTGNEHFVLAGDPPYKMGETYLLFLMPREDGSFLVVSPEGRYRVTGRGLGPMSERDFAQLLREGNVNGVARDLAERRQSLPLE